MTPDERVAAVGALGFTSRQARFLVTVALHGGYCVRRQYDAFAGIQYGKSVRDFLDGLVTRNLATRFVGRADRGHVYHLQARGLYRAIGEEDNRNRRPVSPAQIARKLMVLDYVLSRQDLTWYATERDKVDLFARQFGLALDALPRRIFEGATDTGASISRYFVHKLPIGVPADPRIPHFVYLSTDGSAAALHSFLRDHAALFAAVRRWVLVATGPTAWPGLKPAFDAFLAQPGTTRGIALHDLRWFFARRKTIDRGGIAQVPVHELRRFRELRTRLSGPREEAAYASWLTSGVVPEPETPSPSTASDGALVTSVLPFSYEQFGSLPGVA